MISYLKKEEFIEPEYIVLEYENVIIRNVFEDVKMLKQEIQALSFLKQELVKLPPLWLPNDWKDSDYYRILDYCDLNVQQSVKILQIILLQRKAINNLDFNLIERCLSSGAIYINGYDRSYHPVLLISIEKLIKFNISEVLNTFHFLINLLVKEILIPYYIESIIMIIDCRYCNQSNIPQMIQDFLKQAEMHFYGRFHKIYIIEAQQNQQIIQSLKNETIDRIIFLSQKTLAKLQNQIDPSLLEIKFSGSQSNIIQYWPPKDRREEQKIYDETKSGGKSKFKCDASSSSSFLMLQVYNEEQERILSESHFLDGSNISRIDFDKSISDESQNNSRCYQFGDASNFQSTTIKKNATYMIQCESRELHSDLHLEQNKSKCCKNQECQLI